MEHLRCVEETPEHRLIVEQGLAGVAGALSGMLGQTLFQGRAEISTRSK